MENVFEAVFIIDNNKNEEEIKEIINKINEIIEKHNGKITSRQYLGTKKLAYEIKGHKLGYVYFITFNTSFNDNKYKVEFNTIDAIIKFIIVKV